MIENMKTKEELQELKEQYESLNDKLKELSEGELQQVTGGDWYDFRSFNGVDYDEEVSNIILSNKDVENGTRFNFADHYIIITEIIKRCSPDQYGRMTVLVNMSIRYEVYTNDDVKIKNGYISDFIM